MFKSIGYMLCAAAALLLTATGSFAQDKDSSPFYKKEAADLTKMLIQQESTKKACAKIIAARVEACRAFQAKVSANLSEMLAALDAWQKAGKDEDTPKTWEGKIRYQTLIAQRREIIRSAWNADFFQSHGTPQNTRISPTVHPIKSA